MTRRAQPATPRARRSRPARAALAVVLAVLVPAACGVVPTATDAAVDDAPPAAADAAVDARGDTAPPPSRSREVTAGAMRLEGASYQMEIQVGHAVAPQPMSGAGFTLQGNAAVLP